MADSVQDATEDKVTLDKVVALCKRRGFIFQSSEIYGGLGSTYDYGHYGVLLKNNVKAEWWRSMVQERDDMVALDAAILMHPKTWEASGHLEGFTDPLVQCLGECKKRWREDHLREEQLGSEDAEGEIKCPECGGDLSDPMSFNLMFETHMGPVKESGSEVFLRPETAQGIFVNFKNVLQFAQEEAAVRDRPGRQVLPQRDHARQLHLPHPRVRADGDRVLRPARRAPEVAQALDGRRGWRWYTDLGIRPDHLQLRPHGDDELSHYSSATSDIEYLFPMGFSELEGIANRGDFDLTQHQEFSGTKMDYVDPAPATATSPT